METQPSPQPDPNTPASLPPDPAPCAAPADSVLSSPSPDESGQSEELNTKQLRLLAALVTSTDLQSACKAADVSRASAYLWMKQPAFQDELRRQRNAVLKDALANVKINATRASAELVGLLDEHDPGLRRLVCRDILDRAIRIYDMEDIQTRLTALEKRLKQQSGARP